MRVFVVCQMTHSVSKHSDMAGERLVTRTAQPPHTDPSLSSHVALFQPPQDPTHPAASMHTPR